MDAKKLYDLKETLCKELDNIAVKDSISGSDLDNAHKLTDTVKNIDKIVMLEDNGDAGFSNRGYGYNRGSSNRGSYNDPEMSRLYMYPYESYRRGGNNGYSRHSLREHLEQMLREANSPDERDRIMRMMDMM